MDARDWIPLGIVLALLVAYIVWGLSEPYQPE